MVGKVVDGLAGIGYMVPELASWVGPALAEEHQGGGLPPQRVPQAPQGVACTLPQPP